MIGHRENRYRDVWLLVITVLVVVSVLIGNAENSARIADVNSARIETVVRLCLDTNARHVATVARLEAQIEALPAEERTRAEASKRYTLALINALAPMRHDCRAYALRLTRNAS